MIEGGGGVAERLHPLRLHQLHRVGARPAPSTRSCGSRPTACGRSTSPTKNLKNQQNVVKEEIRVNVQNQPYGALLLARPRGQGQQQVGERPQLLRLASRTSTPPTSRTSRASSRATTARTTPCSAMVGDITAAEVLRAWSRSTSARFPRGRCRRARTSPRAEPAERALAQTDKLARMPAMAVGWKMPARGSSKDYCALRRARRRPAERRRLAALPDARKGKELILQVQGGHQLSVRESMEECRAPRSSAVRPLQAGDGRKAVATRPGRDREGRAPGIRRSSSRA